MLPFDCKEYEGKKLIFSNFLKDSLPINFVDINQVTSLPSSTVVTCIHGLKQLLAGFALEFQYVCHSVGAVETLEKKIVQKGDLGHRRMSYLCFLSEC